MGIVIPNVQPQRTTLRIFFTTLCSVLALATTITGHTSEKSIAERSELYGASTQYAITRKGKRIGTHTLTFTRNGDAMVVNVASKIRVTVLKIPVFSFDYQSTEQWQGNELVSVTGNATENNNTTEVQLRSSAGKSVLTSPKGTTTTARIKHASNHWNIGATDASVVFNTINGKASKVSVKPIAEEQIRIGSETISATRYRSTGNIITDSWYDKNGRWLKLSFEGKDGSLIEYLLE